eukprot:CAMPEP_0196580400 /NCGR_PEP_ID=MMETSP1081-20130531/28604_1 /TAXON_ID=36882 /ORGANISM="Pyramimonas amylifera, Strain CCMP720" /LENGTH=438 /DNA_ID=CAMNT_0041900259 /DNA_START=110 /DNA_END=1426 /DNA_ORIENTATION=-
MDAQDDVTKVSNTIQTEASKHSLTQGASLVDLKVTGNLDENVNLRRIFSSILHETNEKPFVGDLPSKILGALLKVLETSRDEASLNKLVSQMSDWLAAETERMDISKSGTFFVESEYPEEQEETDRRLLESLELQNQSKTGTQQNGNLKSQVRSTSHHSRGRKVSAVLSSKFQPSKSMENLIGLDLLQQRVKQNAGKDAAEEQEDPFKKISMFSQDGVGWNTVERLKSGFKEFREKVEINCPLLFRNLAECQTPKVMVISCCDSRVSPNMILQAQPGDVFTVRNVANLVPPYERSGDYHGTSAALEYAVLHLKVEHLVVLGHSHCGGIKALMTANMETGTPQSEDFGGVDFISKWMRLAVPARERTKQFCKHLDFPDQCRFAEKESINVSLANLLTFPFVKEAVNKGTLNLHGWYYDISGLHLSTWNMRLLISEMETI